MKRLLQFTGLFAWIALMAYAIYYIKTQYTDFFTDLLYVIGGLTLVGGLAYVAIRLIWGDRWFLEGGKSIVVGSDLIAAFQQFFAELPNPSKETLATLAAHLIYRFTRLGLLGLLLAMIPIVLLWQQNQKIEAQNELFAFQNNKIEQQTTLLKTQNNLFEFQNEKVGEQTNLLKIQNDLFTFQNEKVGEQTNLLKTQNDLFKFQNTKVDEQNNLFRTQNDLFEFQNTKVDEQTNLFKTQNDLFTFQNTKVAEQTKLFEDQNDRINIQNNLIEADRRSSLVFLMSNILDKVDEEITTKSKGYLDKAGNLPDSIKIRLSEPLIGRIVALSRAFRPYRMLEGDTLSKEVVSPERGQLFIALMANPLDSLTQNTIVQEGDFSHSIIDEIDLKDAKLNFADLSSADLRSADLSFADLSFADLSSADLSFADLRFADLNSADLNSADLNSADLNSASFSDADLRDAGFNSADLRFAYLRSADLRDADLSAADLCLADLSAADLSAADLRLADLRAADLSAADLSAADLSAADLRYVNFENTRNLSKAQLLSAKTLYKCENLPAELEAALRAERPCLFEYPWEDKKCD